jgi:hypothetical protein
VVDAVLRRRVKVVDVNDPSNPRLASVAGGAPGTSWENVVVQRHTTRRATSSGIDLGGELRIVEVTNPTAPVERSNWGIIADSELEIIQGKDPVSSTWQGIGYDVRHYAHSARAADGGNTVYVSYWDGGIIKLDISNPSSPVELGQATYPVHADGDGHSMTPYDVGGSATSSRTTRRGRSSPARSSPPAPPGPISSPASGDLGADAALRRRRGQRLDA